MHIFQSLHDIIIDSIEDVENLTEEERTALLCSSFGVPFHMLPPPIKNAFRSGAKKYFDRFWHLREYYERG